MPCWRPWTISAAPFIMVTHNEMFLHALARTLIVFREDSQEVFHGGYQRFLEKGGWDGNRPSVKPVPVKAPAAAPAAPLTKKAIRRLRSEIVTEKGKTLKPLEDRASAVEKDIEDQERDIEQWNQALVTASGRKDGAAIVDLSKRIHDGQQAVDRLYDELETLTASLEESRAAFDQRLADLESESS